MKLIHLTKNFLSRSIFSPYLVLVYFYLRIIKREFGFNIFEIFLTISGLIILLGILIKITNKTISNKSYLISYIFSTVLFFTLFFEELLATLNKFYKIANEKYFVYLIFGTLIFLIFILIKKNVNSIKLNFFFNLLFFSYISIELAKILKINIEVTSIKKSSEIIISKPPNISPNVYILIIDGYTSNESLKKYWNFDNIEFSSYLKLKGFNVFDNSKSNYMYTIETMASMFNFGYIEKAKWNKYTLIKNDGIDNKFNELYRKNGYNIDNLSLVDFRNSNKILPNNFYSFLKYKSLISLLRNIISRKIKNIFIILNRNPLKPKLQNDFIMRRNKEVIAFNKIDSITNLNKKKNIIIAHNMDLHPPYDNIDLNLARFSIDSFLINRPTQNSLKTSKLNKLLMDYYLDELIKVNNKYTKLVEEILVKDKNPIIIIMGDHGFRFISGRSRKESNSERYTNFMAVLLPDKQQFNIPISPINVIRYITNIAIGTDFKPLPNYQIQPITQN